MRTHCRKPLATAGAVWVLLGMLDFGEQRIARADPPPKPWNVVLLLTDDLDAAALPFFSPALRWVNPDRPLGNATPDLNLKGDSQIANEALNRSPSLDRLHARMLATRSRPGIAQCDQGTTADEEVCLGLREHGLGDDGVQPGDLAVPADLNFEKGVGLHDDYPSAADFRYRRPAAGGGCNTTSQDPDGPQCDARRDILSGFGGLNRLAQEGVTLQRHYSATSLCAPSRATVFTGRHFQREGVPENNADLPREAVTIAEYLKQGCRSSGERLCRDARTGAQVPCPCHLNPRDPSACDAKACYVTGLVGKWHLGGDDPAGNGFDEVLSFGGGGRDYFTTAKLRCGPNAPACVNSPPGALVPCTTATALQDCCNGTTEGCPEPTHPDKLCGGFGAYLGPDPAHPPFCEAVESTVDVTGGFLQYPASLSSAAHPFCCDGKPQGRFKAGRGVYGLPNKQLSIAPAGGRYRGEAPGAWTCNDDASTWETGCVYEARLFRDHARNFIARHADEPFFLMLAFHSAHDEHKAPKRTESHYDTIRVSSRDGNNMKPPTPTAPYWAIVEEVDAAVGGILAALDENGVCSGGSSSGTACKVGELGQCPGEGGACRPARENTVVLFTSDHGGEGASAYGNPDPRGGKGNVFEGAIRVGMLVRAPGMDGGGVSGMYGSMDRVTSHVDIFPTIAEAAGYDVGADGRLTHAGAGGPGSMPKQLLACEPGDTHPDCTEPEVHDKVVERTVDGVSLLKTVLDVDTRANGGPPVSPAPNERDFVFARYTGEGQAVVSREGYFLGKPCSAEGCQEEETAAGKVCGLEESVQSPLEFPLVGRHEALRGVMRGTSCVSCDVDADCENQRCETAEKHCIPKSMKDDCTDADIDEMASPCAPAETFPTCRSHEDCVKLPPGPDEDVICTPLRVKCEKCLTAAWKLRGDFDDPAKEKVVNLFDVASNVKEEERPENGDSGPRRVDCARFADSEDPEYDPRLGAVREELAQQLRGWTACMKDTTCANPF